MFVQPEGKDKWGCWQRNPNKVALSNVCQDLCSRTNIHIHNHRSEKCHHDSLSQRNGFYLVNTFIIVLWGKVRPLRKSSSKSITFYTWELNRSLWWQEGKRRVAIRHEARIGSKGKKKQYDITKKEYVWNKLVWTGLGKAERVDWALTVAPG